MLPSHLLIIFPSLHISLLLLNKYILLNLLKFSVSPVLSWPKEPGRDTSHINPSFVMTSSVQIILIPGFTWNLAQSEGDLIPLLNPHTLITFFNTHRFSLCREASRHLQALFLLLFSPFCWLNILYFISLCYTVSCLQLLLQLLAFLWLFVDMLHEKYFITLYLKVLYGYTLIGGPNLKLYCGAQAKTKHLLYC